MYVKCFLIYCTCMRNIFTIIVQFSVELNKKFDDLFSLICNINCLIDTYKIDLNYIMHFAMYNFACKCIIFCSMYRQFIK